MTEVNQRKAIQSIHHISAIVGEPQEVIDFYCGYFKTSADKTNRKF